MRQLPMVICDMNLVQLTAVRSQSGVASIWANRLMKTFTNAARPFIGVNAMSADQEITSHNTHNPGVPVNGLGVGIGYVDTGIDATARTYRWAAKSDKRDSTFGSGRGRCRRVWLAGRSRHFRHDRGSDGRPQYVQVPYVENARSLIWSLVTAPLAPVSPQVSGSTQVVSMVAWRVCSPGRR